MTTLTTPTPAHRRVPSASEIRRQPGRGMARALGWFSIGLGLAETLAPRAMAHWTGVAHPRLLQLYGLREIACGIGILSSDQPAGWLWARAAGDAVDLATLAAAQAEEGGARSGRALAATTAVAGVTALDVICGLQLSTASIRQG